MFRLSLRFLGVSPFALFMMDQKNNPALKGHAVTQRGKLLSKMYKELSKNQRRELAKRAASHPTIQKRSKSQIMEDKRKARRKHKTAFSKFVKENFDAVRGLNARKRFAALSKLYSLSRPVQIEEVMKSMEKLQLSLAPSVGKGSTSAKTRESDEVRAVGKGRATRGRSRSVGSARKVADGEEKGDNNVAKSAHSEVGKRGRIAKGTGAENKKESRSVEDVGGAVKRRTPTSSRSRSRSRAVKKVTDENDAQGNAVEGEDSTTTGRKAGGVSKKPSRTSKRRDSTAEEASEGSESEGKDGVAESTGGASKKNQQPRKKEKQSNKK